MFAPLFDGLSAQPPPLAWPKCPNITPSKSAQAPVDVAIFLSALPSPVSIVSFDLGASASAGVIDSGM